MYYEYPRIKRTWLHISRLFVSGDLGGVNVVMPGEEPYQGLSMGSIVPLALPGTISTSPNTGTRFIIIVGCEAGFQPPCESRDCEL